MMSSDDSKVNSEATESDSREPQKWEWFRFYAEFSEDPKCQSMSEADQRRFLMILCLRARKILHQLSDRQIACALRISTKSLGKTKKVFMTNNFVDEDWNITHWDKRQYLETEGARRVREHRERKRNRNVTEPLQERYSNVTETLPPVTETLLAGARSDTELREQSSEEIHSPLASANVPDTALDPSPVERPALRDTHACEGEPTTQESPRRLKATDYDGVNYAQAKIEAHRAEANGKA